MSDAFCHPLSLLAVGFGIGVGTGAGIRIFDWIMQEVFHEGHNHDE